MLYSLKKRKLEVESELELAQATYEEAKVDIGSGRIGGGKFFISYF